MRAVLAGLIAGLVLVQATDRRALAQDVACPWELPLVPEDTGRERYEYPSQAMKAEYKGRTVEYSFVLGARQTLRRGASIKPPGCVRTTIDVRAGLGGKGCRPAARAAVAGRLSVRCPNRYYWNDRGRIERVCRIRLAAERVRCGQMLARSASVRTSTAGPRVDDRDHAEARAQTEASGPPPTRASDVLHYDAP